MKGIFELYNSLGSKDKITFVATVITSIGVFFTFIISLVNIYISKKRLRLDNITSNRVDWINTLKIYVSDFIMASDLTNIQAIEPKREIVIKLREKLSRTSLLIKLHLNFKGEIDKRIINELDEIINGIYLFTNLRIIRNARNICEIESPKTACPEGLKLYLDKYTDKNILYYLNDYSIENNINTKIPSNYKKETLVKLKEMVIKDYCSVIGGTYYADEFMGDISAQLDTISEDLHSNRYNLIKLTQVYLKAEWIRVNIEVRPWPFNIYKEKDTLSKLEKEWDEINSRNE